GDRPFAGKNLILEEHFLYQQVEIVLAVAGGKINIDPRPGNRRQGSAGRCLVSGGRLVWQEREGRVASSLPGLHFFILIEQNCAGISVSTTLIPASLSINDANQQTGLRAGATLS